MAAAANPIDSSITWTQIIQAGKAGNASQAVCRIVLHLHAHRTDSLDQIEQRLRLENSVIHIFAETIAEKASRGQWPAGCSCRDIQSNEKRPYVIRVLISSYPDLRPIIANLSQNPDENLRRLKDQTGIPIAPPQISQLIRQSMARAS